MENTKQANLEIAGEQEVISPEDKKRLEKQRAKEEKKKKEYARSMITRAEAYQISENVATQEVSALAEFIREPLRANLVQTMAVIELLKDKGLIENDEEFQKYLDIVAEKLEKTAEAVETSEQE